MRLLVNACMETFYIKFLFGLDVPDNVGLMFVRRLTKRTEERFQNVVSSTIYFW